MQCSFFMKNHKFSLVIHYFKGQNMVNFNEYIKRKRWEER